MKLIIITTLFSFSVLANTRVVCFKGKVGPDTIDRICFDPNTLDPKATKIISTDEKGISTIEVTVLGTSQSLTLYSTQSTFNKKVQE